MSGARAPLPSPGCPAARCCPAPAASAPGGTAACPGGSARILRRAHIICAASHGKGTGVHTLPAHRPESSQMFVSQRCPPNGPEQHPRPAIERNITFCKVQDQAVTSSLCSIRQFNQPSVGNGSHLNAREHHQELDCKVGQLKHHAAALSAPLLLPVVQPVGDEAPADADEGLLRYNLLPCEQQPLWRSGY